MGLTEAVRLRLEGNGFKSLFTKHEPLWTKRAEQARTLMAEQIGGDREPTVDDIKKVLQPLIEIVPELRNFLQARKLKQKYWIGDFTDYIIDRVYTPELDIPEEE
jgi:hypothetical protein